MNFKKIFNLMKFNYMILLLWLILSVYQTCLIIEQYLNYNSIINIKFTKNTIDAYPAITICYNEVFSFEKLAQHYNKEEIFANYTKFLKDSVKIKRDENGNNFIASENAYFNKNYQRLKCMIVNIIEIKLFFFHTKFICNVDMCKVNRP